MKQQQQENQEGEENSEEVSEEPRSYFPSYTSLISISLAVRDEENKTV